MREQHDPVAVRDMHLDAKVVTPKGSRFLLCQLSQTNPEYAKYPPQPVVRCDGHRKEEQAGGTVER